MVRTLSGGIFCALFVVALLSSRVSAGGLAVYGGKIEADVVPGNDYSYSIDVGNNSDAPMRIQVQVKGYAVILSGEADMPGEEKHVHGIGRLAG